MLGTALAGRGQTHAEIVAALSEELEEVDPERAAKIDPKKPGARRYIIAAVEERAPDGWPFGKAAVEERAPDGWPFGKNKRGEYGYWPLGHEYWPKGSLYDHL